MQKHNDDLQSRLESSEKSSEDYKQKCEALQAECREMEQDLEELHISQTIGSMPETSIPGVHANEERVTVKIGSSGLVMHAKVLVDVFRINDNSTVKRISSHPFSAGNIYTKKDMLKMVEKKMHSTNRLTQLPADDRAQDLMVAWHLVSDEPMAWSVARPISYEKWCNAVQAVCASREALAKNPTVRSVKPHDEGHNDGHLSVFFAAKDKYDVMKKAMDDLPTRPTTIQRLKVGFYR